MSKFQENEHTPGNFSETLKKEGYYLRFMCKAEGDYLYIVTDVKGPNPILKVKSVPTKLIVRKIKNIQHKMDQFSFMYYLPDVKCLAISFRLEHVVKAIHFETSEEVWKVKGKVHGIT